MINCNAIECAAEPTEVRKSERKWYSLGEIAMCWLRRETGSGRIVLLGVEAVLTVMLLRLRNVREVVFCASSIRVIS